MAAWMGKVLGFLRYLAVWFVSTATALLGMLPPAVLGLVVPGQVVLPLAMCVGAIFAAVAESFVGNRLPSTAHVATHSLTVTSSPNLPRWSFAHLLRPYPMMGDYGIPSRDVFRRFNQ